MSNKRKSKYTCEDCKWNFMCKDGIEARCEEFELDRLLSDTYASKVIERKRREFQEYWDEYLSEWEDA